MIPDIQSLKEFDLIWRFSDEKKYTQLTKAEFNRFCPVPTKDSLKLWEKYVYPGSGELERHLSLLYSQKNIKWPEYNYPTFRSNIDMEQGETIFFLEKEIRAKKSSGVIFFWHAEVCVRTNWELFLAHWDDFCYPSDDSNVVILPGLDKSIVYIEDMWHILPRKEGKTIFLKHQ